MHATIKKQQETATLDLITKFFKKKIDCAKNFGELWLIISNHIALIVLHF